MRKLLAALLAVSMLASFAIPAFAEEPDAENSIDVVYATHGGGHPYYPVTGEMGQEGIASGASTVNNFHLGDTWTAESAYGNQNKEIVDIWVAEGTLGTNNGDITVNFGTITENTQDGQVYNNLEDSEITNNGGLIRTNGGKVVKNQDSGEIIINDGVVQVNDSVIDLNGMYYGGEVQKNTGLVGLNFTGVTNSGTGEVGMNFGFVMLQDGANAESVGKNYSVVADTATGNTHFAVVLLNPNEDKWETVKVPTELLEKFTAGEKNQKEYMQYLQEDIDWNTWSMYTTNEKNLLQYTLNDNDELVGDAPVLHDGGFGNKHSIVDGYIDWDGNFYPLGTLDMSTVDGPLYLQAHTIWVNGNLYLAAGSSGKTVSFKTTLKLFGDGAACKAATKVKLNGVVMANEEYEIEVGDDGTITIILSDKAYNNLAAGAHSVSLVIDGGATYLNYLTK